MQREIAIAPVLAHTLPAEAPLDTPAQVRPTNYARSAFHFGSAAVALITVALFQSHTGILVIALVFAGYAWSMEIGRRVYPPLNARLMRFYAPIAHPHETYRVNSATWYATALLVLALFAARPVTMASLAVLGVADPIAGMVGRRWGKRVLRAGRSLEGTIAFVVSGAVAAALALAVAGGVAPGELVVLAVLSGLAGGIAELFATRLDDNLLIPLTVAGVLTAAIALG